jgi:integrase
MTLTTPVLRPTPLTVVWTPTLQSESEGPPLIVCTARLHQFDRPYIPVSSPRRRGAMNLRPLGPEPSNNSLICPMNRALRRDGMPRACLFGCSDPAHSRHSSASKRTTAGCARLCHLASGKLDQIQFLLGHVSIQTTERYLGCQQKLRYAVNDTLAIESECVT